MQLQDESVILKTLKIKEQNEVLTFFTKNNGVMNGYWRKRRSNISISSIGIANYYSRLSENLGYVSFETTDNIFSKVFCDEFKCIVLNAITQLLCIIMPVNMPLYAIYLYFHSFLISIKSTDTDTDSVEEWLDDCILLLMNILKHLGFGLNLTYCSVTNSTENLCYISPKTGHVVTKEIGDPYKHLIYPLPKLMRDLSIDKIDMEGHKRCIYSLEEYILSFKILFFFIEKNLLIPYNLKMPFWCKNIIKKLSDNNKYR